MAVLVEAISVIVRLDSVERKFLGGRNGFVESVPNATLCADADIARVGFMSPKNAEVYIKRLEHNGLTFLVDGTAVDIAVVDQQRGLTTNCSWLEFGRLPFGEEGAKVSVCWLFEGPRLAAGLHMRGTSMELSTPAGWSFENSLSQRFDFVPTGKEDKSLPTLPSATERTAVPVAGIRMTDAATAVVAACLGRLLEDEPWQDLGFAKRPRHGSFFDRFRPAWKNDLEASVIQQMLATFTAAYAIADRITSEDIPRVVAAYSEEAGVVAALGYASRDECVHHLTKAIAQYRRTPLRDWNSLLTKRIDPTSIPDKKLSAAILVGCIRFAQNVTGMIHILRTSPSSH